MGLPSAQMEMTEVTKEVLVVLIFSRDPLSPKCRIAIGLVVGNWDWKLRRQGYRPQSVELNKSVTEVPIDILNDGVYREEVTNVQ